MYCMYDPPGMRHLYLGFIIGWKFISQPAASSSKIILPVLSAKTCDVLDDQIINQFCQLRNQAYSLWSWFTKANRLLILQGKLHIAREFSPELSECGKISICNGYPLTCKEWKLLYSLHIVGWWKSAELLLIHWALRRFSCGVRLPLQGERSVCLW